MKRVVTKPGWKISEALATPESTYMNRRYFIKRMARTGLASALLTQTGCKQDEKNDANDAQDTPVPNVTSAVVEKPIVASRTRALYPAQRNPSFVLQRPLTEESIAATYNNFYEFSTEKEKVSQLTANFRSRPWTIAIEGLVEKPMVFDIDDLVQLFDLEERLYRHRCVEAWAMAVPWTGFPLRKLIEHVGPKKEATHVRFISFEDKTMAPGFEASHWYPWPYFEGLTLAEAMHDLTLVVTGIYGHELPVAHGAPVRVVVPWKYGYKGPKSVVKIELVDAEPATFWSTLESEEYPFQSNVNPDVPHPRWSQASERMLGTNERRDTQIYNGYGESVATLYR